jgi:hypothetical protein
MAQLTALYRQTDVGGREWMARRAVPRLRCSRGLGFFWCGGLQVVPDLSPAADRAERTLTTRSLGWVAPGQVRPGLAAWACSVARACGQRFCCSCCKWWAGSRRCSCSQRSPLTSYPQEAHCDGTRSS